jgi:hypothetical protein
MTFRLQISTLRISYATNATLSLRQRHSAIELFFLALTASADPSINMGILIRLPCDVNGFFHPCGEPAADRRKTAD